MFDKVLTATLQTIFDHLSPFCVQIV